MTAIRGQGRWAAFLPALLGMAAAAGTVGCQQKMAEQPYYRPYEPTISFPDGRSRTPRPELPAAGLSYRAALCAGRRQRNSLHSNATFGVGQWRGSCLGARRASKCTCWRGVLKKNNEGYFFSVAFASA